jgi:ribosomal protein L37AE/L43A
LIIKDQTTPLIIQKLQALLRRLPADHPKQEFLREDLKKFEAGYRGEQNVKYHLSFLPQNDYHFFYDLRLSTQEHLFQIDVLLLTSKFIMILEVKNIYGTLFFEKQFHQFIRTTQDKEEGFPNPLFQAQRHSKLLKQWLHFNKFPEIPVDYLVVISNPSSILKTSETDHDILNKIIHAEKVTLKIQAISKKFSNSILTARQLKKLSSKLMIENLPQEPNILRKYELLPESILKGVQCPECKAIPIQRKNGYWLCSFCGNKSKSAHQQAIIDYLLLINPTISNQACRDFLSIACKDTALLLLKTAGLKAEKKGRGSNYYLY